LACRVRVRIKRGGKVIESLALLNSGFESDSPDIAVPIEVAAGLGLWPPRSAATAVLDTGGGEISVPYYKSCAELELILEDREPKKAEVNIIVNPHLDEIALSDYVASELGIILLDFKRGVWRLNDDPPDKIRRSAHE